jgi:hypothetical protein
MLEGFIDAFGPFNPAAVIGEAFNFTPASPQMQMGTWPNVNRVQRMGAFKAPPLRNVELTGPYFHTGSELTLRQELNFYLRGGDFPITNAAHRDFLLMDLDIEDEALGGVDPVTLETEFTEEQKEAIRVAMIDFLIELTDERVAHEKAPFDRPEMIVPVDGTAPDITIGGRSALLIDQRFRHVPAIGAAGRPEPLANFLNVSSTPGDPGPDHYDSVTVAPAAEAPTRVVARIRRDIARNQAALARELGRSLPRANQILRLERILTTLQLQLSAVQQADASDQARVAGLVHEMYQREARLAVERSRTPLRPALIASLERRIVVLRARLERLLGV